MGLRTETLTEHPFVFRWVSIPFHLFPIQYAESRFIADNENMFQFELPWKAEAWYFSLVLVVESQKGLTWASDCGWDGEALDHTLPTVHFEGFCLIYLLRYSLSCFKQCHKHKFEVGLL